MELSEQRQQQVVDRQIDYWTAELRRLAGLIAAAKDTSCALVTIYSTDHDYVDIAPS